MIDDTTLTPFGDLLDGRPVRAARLAWEGGLSVVVLEYGCTLHSIRFPLADEGGVSRKIETTLGYPDLQGYLDDRDYQGRLVGRVANRIAGAHFELDGETYPLSANPAPTTLHGGNPGFGAVLWTLEVSDGRRVVMSYVSPDGEAGFPGEVQARATLELTAPDTLEIVWEATTDRPTPVSLTHHPYFNLSGRPRSTILDHTLQVAAQAVLPVRPGLIPTGEFLPLERTPFDLRAPRVLGEALSLQHQQLVIPRGYDLNWVLDEDAAQARSPAAVLRSPGSGLSLTLTTDQPGMQIYSGQGLGHPFVPHGALVLEPQGFPNAVNQPEFPSVILRPGETYRRFATYRFEAGSPGVGAPGVGAPGVGAPDPTT